MPTLQSIGKGEGKLNVIAWDGYTEPEWVKPFEQQTGCKVNTKVGTTSSDMVSLMANGGGGQYDLVSASGDADLRLIYGGDVQAGQRQPHPGVEGLPPVPAEPVVQHDRRHALRRVAAVRARTCCCTRRARSRPRPTRGRSIYDNKYKGKVTVPNNPIQIADAALYLSKTQPDLGITDPYELTQPQFDAAVNLLKQQKPLVKKYWNLPSEEESLFQNGEAVVGAAWPLQTGNLKKAGLRGRRHDPEARARPVGPTRGCSRPRRRTRTARTSG